MGQCRKIIRIPDHLFFLTGTVILRGLPGSRGPAVESKVENDTLILTLKPAETNRWFYVVAGADSKPVR